MSERRIGRLEQLEKFINKSISLHTKHFYGDERPETEEKVGYHCPFYHDSLQLFGCCKKALHYMQLIVISFERKLTPKSGCELNQ